MDPLLNLNERYSNGPNSLNGLSDDPELFTLRPFVTACSLYSQGFLIPFRALVDTGCTAYSLIHSRLVPMVCDQLGLEPVPLSKPKRVRGFNGELSKLKITHAIYPGLLMKEKHRETTVPMLIADLGQHDIILGKPWMNRNQLVLNMKDDSIVFPQKPFPSSPLQTPLRTPLRTPLQTVRITPKILPRPSPTADDNAFSVCSVGAAPYAVLARQEEVQIFAMSMKDIDKQLALDRECRSEELSLKANASEHLEEIRRKLPPEYHEYLDVFDRSQASKLSPQSRAYHMSPYKLQKVKEYLNENLSKGFITPSKAAYSSPVLFAQKANGDLRFCIDYRKLNAITKRNRYPLPLIEEVLGKILGCKHLTRLNILAAFNPLRMHSDSEDLTTFITALGSYTYRVLPFGLTNGPSTFQQYINDTLWGFLTDFCQAYLDNILIYSKTRKEHRIHVKKVLERLREAGLQVDIKKCEFDVSETVFLGVIISGEGLRMDPQKVKAVLDWVRPTNLKEVQGFIGFANFYRRFIQDFSKIVKPLVALTRKEVPFAWTEDCTKAFQDLKQAMTKAPVLRHFDPSHQAILETDTSDLVTGGILSQYDHEGVLHPVAFYNKSMIPAECNYHIYDKELLAIIRCFEHWCPELKHTDLPIQVFTDHQALKTFREDKKLTRRQARYLDILSEFNFQVISRTGKANGKADATPDRVEIHVGEVEENLVTRVSTATQEQANQGVEQGLQTVNNTRSSATSLSPFYLDKGFHPRMSFDPHITTYESTRPGRGLEDKQLGPFRVSQHVRTSYRLGLHAIMRIHNQTPPPAPIVANDKGHWKVDNTPGSRSRFELFGTFGLFKLFFRMDWPTCGSGSGGRQFGAASHGGSSVADDAFSEGGVMLGA